MEKDQGRREIIEEVCERNSQVREEKPKHILNHINNPQKNPN